MSLREQLVHEVLRGYVRPHELSAAALWPASTELAAWARERHRGPAQGLGVGEAWLIAVHPNDRRGSLWRLGGAAPHAELVTDARECARSALKRAHGALPVTPRLLDAEVYTATHAALVRCVDGGTVGPSLKGGSFGVAMVLAAASRCLGIPLPDGLLCTTAIAADGLSAEVVEFLPDKVAFVIEEALGITQLMVHRDQVSLVKEKLGASLDKLHGREIEVIGVSTLRDAVEAVFPELDETLARRWATPGAARAAAEQLYRDIARNDRATDSWLGVARAAALLRGAGPLAQWIGDVAARHQGDDQRLLPWPSEESLAVVPADLRWIELSQLLQSAADYPHDDRVAVRYLTASEEYANEYAEASADGRRFLGARARALAAIGRVEEAAERLERVVAAWWRASEAERPHASFALSELLRLRGFVGSAEEAARAWGWAQSHCEHPLVIREGLGVDYVRRAWARSLVLRGRAREALELLSRESGAPVVRRWRARALDAMEMRDDARAQRGAISSESDEGACAAALAALDQALIDRGSTASALNGACAVARSGAEVRRMLLQRRTSVDACSREHAQEIADRYRY